MDTAASPTTPIYTCSVATTRISMSRAARRTRITLFSGSSGGITLQQGRGNRSAQRAICLQSWPPCQVIHQLRLYPTWRTDEIYLRFVLLFYIAVLHGNNLLVFGGTGIPFGENNGNDVHVCNVKYKRWSLLNCRGKKPNRIYGQVKTVHTDDTSVIILHYSNGHITKTSSLWENPDAVS